MSKELETLSIIKLRLRQSEKLFEDIFVSNDEPIKETLKELKDAIKSTKIIETALKNYEELTNTPPILWGRTHGNTQSIIDYICKHYKEVKITNLEDEEKLKAFEIIKTKKVNVWCVLRVSLEEYNTKFVNQDWRKLTQKEYNLLKEVLL